MTIYIQVTFRISICSCLFFSDEELRSKHQLCIKYIVIVRIEYPTNCISLVHSYGYLNFGESFILLTFSGNPCQTNWDYLREVEDINLANNTALLSYSFKDILYKSHEHKRSTKSVGQLYKLITNKLLKWNIDRSE